MSARRIRAGWPLAAVLVLCAACAPGPAAGSQALIVETAEWAPVSTPPATAAEGAAETGESAPGAAEPDPPAPAATTGSPATPVPLAPCSPEVCVEPGRFLLARPIAPPGRLVVDPTYRYGSTQNGAREPHHGVEFLNSAGTPVLAAAAGKVVVAGNDRLVIYAEWPYFYGNLVILEHEFPEVPAPVFTLYAHLSEVQVSPGEQVAPGQPIGLVGLSGVATGSHLHFEVRVGENLYESTRNPELWLQPLLMEDGQPAGALAGRIEDGKGQTIPMDNLVLERLDGPDQTPVLWGYLETYADPALAGAGTWEESFALGDLPAGWYRLTFVYRGLQTRDFEILPGQLTRLTFTIED